MLQDDSICVLHAGVELYEVNASHYLANSQPSLMQAGSSVSPQTAGNRRGSLRLKLCNCLHPTGRRLL